MSRGQVDLIDMQSQPDGGFKFLFKICVLMPLKFKTACAVAKILVDILSLMDPPSILQYDNGHEFKTQEIKNEVLKMWSGLRMVSPDIHNPRGQFKRANRDVENLLACWQAENNSTNWSRALNII